MKKYLLIIFTLSSIYAGSQSPLHPMLKTYFRAHPFDSKFSSFIQSLQKDPWFTIDAYDRRTDSSLFYLSGTYKNFNPFRYAVQELRLIIAEEIMVYADSLKTMDTIINLQLLGISENVPDAQKMVEKEFKRFKTSQSKNYYETTYKNFQQNGTIVAELNNYFVFPYSISPVSTAWGHMPDTKQFTFTITIRFKVDGNVAGLINPPEGF